MEPIVFMLCLTLHNLEEALWLTEWRNTTMPNFGKPPLKSHFIFAVLGITILGYLASGLHLFFPSNAYFAFCYIGFVGAMLINVIIPHLLLTLRYKKYCPGIFTGLCLLMPFNSILLYRLATSSFQISDIIVSTVVIGAILLALIPIFEVIAKHVLRDFNLEY